MFGTDQIAQLADSACTVPKVSEFSPAIRGGGVPNDMVVNVAAIDMSAENKSVIALKKAFCKFISDTVGFFRRDFSRFE